MKNDFYKINSCDNEKLVKNEKIINRILLIVLIIFCAVLAVMGFNIEKKLNNLQTSSPVSVYTSSEQSVSDSSEYSYTATSAIQSELYIQNTTYTSIQAPVSDTDSELSSEPTYTTTQNQSQATETTYTANLPDLTASHEAAHHSEHSNSSAHHSDDCYYITSSGTKYHADGCSYLSKSKISITLDEALGKGYEPCSRCIE